LPADDPLVTDSQETGVPRLPEASALTVAPDPRHVAATIALPAEERVVQQEVLHHRHHTLVPRTLCFAGQLAWFAIPMVVIALFDAGRADFDDKGVLTLDAEGVEMVRNLGLVASAAYLVGWLWWATIAAMNAKHISRHTVWAGTPVAAFVVQVAAVVAGAQISMEDDMAHTAVQLSVAAVVVIAHFTVIGTYRRAAGSIRAPQGPWTRLIVLPWAALAFNLVLAFFLNFVSEPLAVTLLGAQIALLAWYVMSFYQAMSSFDQATVGRAILGQDDQAFAKFLKHRS
jgi:hypothetical protein